MDIDWEAFKFVMTIIALIAFNIPILICGFGAWSARQAVGYSEALREKDPEGQGTGSVSYSRVTGMIGAIVVASLFWIMSNVAIGTAILNPKDLPDILTGVTKLFFVGAALFLPYAFNQLKTLVQ
jgi:hypothetical protein